MVYPLVVKGRIFRGGALERGAIAIDPGAGEIVAVGKDLPGKAVHDHGDLAILPGAVDIHVHFRDPGHPEKEDFASGTLSALHGGVTTVFDMPNTDPSTTTAEAYAAKTEIVAPKAYVDWGLYGGATQPGPALRALAQVAPAIKIYLGESTGGVTLGAPGMLEEVFADLHEAGSTGVVAFHAEAADVMHSAGEKHRTDPGLAGHEARRPAKAELQALDQIEKSLREHTARHGPPGFRIHIAHASSAALLQRLVADGWSFGVTPHHMLLDHSMPLGSFGRVNPPLRNAGDAQMLLRALADDKVPIVESDHAPHTMAEKQRDVSEAPSGLPGVETMAPLLLARVTEGTLPLAPVVHALATRPARLMGLMKGQIEPRYDADLAVYDLTATTTVDGTRLHSRAGWTPYEGSAALFPTHVYVRGKLALKAGRLRARPGSGRMVRPGAAPVEAE